MIAALLFLRAGSTVVWEGKSSCYDNLMAARPEGQSLVAGEYLKKIYSKAIRQF